MAAILVVLVGGGALLWTSTRSSDSEACTIEAAANEVDDVGAPSPEQARIRWAAGADLGIDPARPILTGGRDGEIVADYELDEAHRHEVGDGRIAVLTIITRRDADGVWRVTSANRCDTSAI